MLLALHIVSFVAWMAGLLYLYRLFVYFAEESVPVVRERLATMTDRLYRIITVPAMLATFLFGIWMIVSNPAILREHWLHAKLVLVVAMGGLTGVGGKIRREQLAGKVRYSGKTFRILNEVPTLLLILIVALVILRPF